MNKQELEIIKAEYDERQGGISNPLKTNQAYNLIPQCVENTPMAAKQRAINRFMMLSYNDYVNEIPAEPITDSIGTAENLTNQSHSEDTKNNKSESQDIMEFLTTEEAQDLASKTAGTELVTNKASGKQTKTKVVAKKRTGRPAQTKTITRNK